MPDWQAPFHHHYDHAILGTGLAGCAAALSLAARGRRVVLIGALGDIAWEWGRALVLVHGETEAEGWGTTIDALRRVGGCRVTGEGPLVEGSSGELVVFERLRGAGVDLAFMLWPVGTARDSAGRLVRVAFACKSGLRWISASRWIDASEEGTLAQLLGAPRPVVAARHWHYRWQSARPIDAPAVSVAGGTAILGPGSVPGERALELITGPEGRAGELLARWSELPEAWRGELSQQLLSHAGVASLDRYVPAEVATPAPNLALAVPGLQQAFSTPADRWAIGVGAARTSADQDPAEPIAASPGEDAGPDHETEVVVVGAGTGGALAAIAAAESGARTLVVEPLASPGGVGVNAGIHWYWFGVPGGLQQAIDEETHEAMLALGIESDLRRQPWQPDVKGWVLDRRLARAGVDRRYGSLCYGVERSGRRIDAIRVATPQGPIRIRATAWVDSSGDGDLCALAGARFQAGRDVDGRFHACTQSARQIEADAEGIPRMKVVNFDSGWVDPEDPADWTRARCDGLAAYVAVLHEDEPQRHTIIAPALGIRQSRQILTRQILTIDDVFACRDFPDAIGFAGCNVDNHSPDFALEDPGFIFGRCVLGNGGIGRPVVALPYGMVVPQDLDNVWIGCRACGLTQHAHYPIRQMRDIHRLGEACGLAAALARDGRANHEIDLEALQERLRASGALGRQELPAKPVLCTRTVCTLKGLGARSLEADIAAAQEGLALGKPRLGLWWMARRLDEHRAGLCERIDDPDPEVRFLAAATLAFGGDPAGADHLLAVWLAREQGGGGVPHWYRALCLLRCSATATHLAAMALQLPSAPVLHDVVLPIVLAACEVRSRTEAAQDSAAAILAWARSVRTVGTHRPPQFSMESLLLDWSSGGPIDAIVYQAGHARDLHATRYVGEDWTWQRRILCARLAILCGASPEPDLLGLDQDERAYVRRAATRVSTVLDAAPT